MYQGFVDICCFHLQGKKNFAVVYSSTTIKPSTSLQGAITQNISTIPENQKTYFRECYGNTFLELVYEGIDENFFVRCDSCILVEVYRSLAGTSCLLI
jgi:hypothetical protein